MAERASQDGQSTHAYAPFRIPPVDLPPARLAESAGVPPVMNPDLISSRRGSASECVTAWRFDGLAVPLPAAIVVETLSWKYAPGLF